MYVKTYKRAAKILGVHWFTLKRLVKRGHLTPEPYPLSDTYGIVFDVNKLKTQFAIYYLKNKHFFTKKINLDGDYNESSIDK